MYASIQSEVFMKKLVCVSAVLCAALVFFTACASKTTDASVAPVLPSPSGPVVEAPVFETKEFTYDMYAAAPESVRNTIARCDELIADAKFRSARAALSVDEDLGKDEDYILYKQVEVITNYFCFSMMHTMFDIQDFNSFDELLEYRHNISYGNQDMTFSLTFGEGPDSWIDDYEAEYGKTPRSCLARAQYYYDVSQRYGDQWLKPYNELIQLSYENYKEAVEGGFYDLTALSRYAECALFSRNFQDAHDAYLQVVTYVSDNGAFWYNLGTSTMYLGNYTEAIDYAKMAILNPEEGIGEQIDAWLLLSDAYLYSGDVISAEKPLVDVTNMYPDQPYPLYKLGCYYYESADRQKDAVDAFTRSIQAEWVNGGFRQSTMYAVQYLLEYGDVENCHRVLDSAKKIVQSDSDALGSIWYLDAQVFFMENDRENCIKAVGEAEKQYLKNSGPEAMEELNYFKEYAGL